MYTSKKQAGVKYTIEVDFYSDLAILKAYVP